MGLAQTKSRLSASLGTTKIHDRPSAAGHWVDGEIDEDVFRDARLGKRFRELLIQMCGGIGESIPLACQDWANTKAAYRFFANERVCEGNILSAHFDATRARFEAARGHGAATTRHDRVYLPARSARTCRRYEGYKQRQGQKRSLPPSHALRHPSSPTSSGSIEP
jgi:hypothetical protein